MVEALPNTEGREVLVNSQPRLFSSTQRVDLTVIDRASNSVLLLDFKSPFEASQEAFTDARARNVAKYAALAECYRSRGFRASVDTMCVGALGSWDPDNQRPLQQLGLSRTAIKPLALKVCNEVLQVSRNIWVEHCTGVPQTF